MIHAPAIPALVLIATGSPDISHGDTVSCHLEPSAVAPAATMPAISPLPSPMLPAGGPEFHSAVLGWTASSVTSPTGDLLKMPVSAGRLSSRFGIRHDPMNGRLRAHSGIDIPDVAGAPVRTAASGVVTFAGWRRGYGNLVEIDHGSGSATRYGHLGVITVMFGTSLPQGEVIGLIGSTGRSTGPHLHFEVRQDGMAVDPLRHLGQALPAPVPIPPGPIRQSWNGYSQDAGALPQSQLR